MASATIPGRPVSSLAIACLVLGIITLLTLLVPLLPLAFGVLAIVLGVVGIRKVRRGTATGQGMAVAGIICAALGMIPSLVMVASFITGLLTAVSGN